MIDLNILKFFYDKQDRQSIQKELKKEKTISSGPICFFVAWYINTKKNKYFIDQKKVLEYLDAFFNWYFSTSNVPNCFNDLMLEQALNMFFENAQQIDQNEKWGHRKYPTPLKNITIRTPNERVRFLSNYLYKLHQDNKFTIEELYHMALHTLQNISKFPNEWKVPKDLLNIAERMVTWLGASGAKELAEELAFYYQQINPSSTLLETINPHYDEKGNLIPSIYTDASNPLTRDPATGMPLLVARMLKSLKVGGTTEQHLLPKFDDPSFIKRAAEDSGNVAPGTIFGNSRTLYTLILLNDNKEGVAQKYYRKHVINYSGASKEMSIAWYCEHFSTEEKSARTAESNRDSQEFQQVVQTFIESSRLYGTKKYKSTGPKKMKLPEENKIISGHYEGIPSSSQYSPSGAWREAERIAKTDCLTIEVSDYKLYYYQGSGSRVHFIVYDANCEKIAGFTHHMDHEEQLCQQINKQRDELIRFGIALNSAKKVKYRPQASPK